MYFRFEAKMTDASNNIDVCGLKVPEMKAISERIQCVFSEYF